MKLSERLQVFLDYFRNVKAAFIDLQAVIYGIERVCCSYIGDDMGCRCHCYIQPIAMQVIRKSENGALFADTI